jgi:hypothetical protein
VNASKQAAVYLIVARVDTSGFDDIKLLRTVDYYGTTDREERGYWLRFAEHCKKRGFTSKTHGMVIFKQFTSDSIDQKVFSSPGFAALAYELRLSMFRKLFDLGSGACNPGSSSKDLNKELGGKLNGDEYTAEVSNRLIEILRNPVFVEEPKAPEKKFGWFLIWDF